MTQTQTLEAPPLLRRQLAPPWRKLLLSIHLIASVGLVGTDAAVLTLNIAGWRHADAATIYPSAHLIGLWLLLPLAVASVVTGLLMGSLTRWGVTRYWWVTIKLVLNLAGLVLAITVLLPGLSDAANAASTLHAPGPDANSRSGLVLDTAAASTVLITTVLLAVFKPFGRLRGQRRHSRPAARPDVSSAGANQEE
jgi:uncharacterized membrane protein